MRSRRKLDPLPIDEVLPSILDSLARTPNLVLRAPTGAGKTTRVAPALLDSAILGRTAGSAALKIVVLEPRRVAARAAARRMSFERGTELGKDVGYSVRFDRRTGPTTRIVVMTEGLLVRRLQEDPFLEDVGAVLFDELHERSLDADLALAMTRKLQRELRPDLRLVAMSATLEAGPIAAFLGDCPIVDSEGRLFPVEVRHHDAAVGSARTPGRDTLGYGSLAIATGAVVSTVRTVLEETPGDVLVFLPGVGEIRRTREALERARLGPDLVELYGDLAAERQDAALSAGPRRKIVLATNVAETSVTVENVTAVVDSGLARVLSFDASIGLDRLELVRVSRSSAEQRKGRAGRTQPGLCIRLWSAHDHRALRERTEPEVRRVDIAPAHLQLRAWGESDPAQFQWLEAPSPAASELAEQTLAMLGATGTGGLTATGRAMAELPVAPRLARLLIEGHRSGTLERTAAAAALLSERDPFRRPSVGRGRPHAGGGHRTDGALANAAGEESDLLDRIVALEAAESGRQLAGVDVNRGALRFVMQTRDQLVRTAKGVLGRAPARANTEDAVRRAILTAFPDRVARRREPGSGRAKMVGGRGVGLADDSAVVTSRLFVCLDVDAGRRGARAEALVRLASSIEREWLPADAVTTASEVAFDEPNERVTERERTVYRDLVLGEKNVAVTDHAEAARLLAEAAAERLDRALTLDDPELGELRARIALLARAMPELRFPSADDDALRALLPELANGRRSFEELRRIDVAAAIRNRLDYRQARALDEHAPERLPVPSGSRIRVSYQADKPPVLAARIQELFGMTETPRVCAGRVAVVVHLLAPNRRPQQVTDDLASFWTKTYPEVRKELRARYPKHAWPEDPMNAKAERRPRRKARPS